MALITATKSGLWDDDTVWDSGSQPQDGDDVDLDEYVISATNLSIPISGGKLNSLTGRNLTVLGDCVIDCDDIYAVGPSDLISATSHTSIVINGNIHASSTTTSIKCVNISGTGTGIINGNIFGGSVLDAVGLSVSTSANVTINGNITGGSETGAQGVIKTGTGGNLVINGNIIGGNKAYGLSVGGTNTNVTINGNTAGGSTGTETAHGIYNDTTSSTIIQIGNVSGGNNRNTYGLFNNSTGYISITGDLTFTLGPPLAGLIFYNPLPSSKIIINSVPFYQSLEEVGGAIFGGLGNWNW